MQVFKKCILAVLVLGLLMSMAACGGETASAPAESSGSAPASVEAAPAKDTLIVIPYMLTESFDPYEADLDPVISSSLFDYLFMFDANGDVVGNLVESFTESEDGLTIECKLREDVTFSDGTPFNADAVIYNYNKGLESPVVSYYLYEIAGMEKVDDYHVNITKIAPYSKVAAVLTQSMPIVSPTAYDADQAAFATNPVGTGAYLLENYDASTDYVTMTAREDYFRGAPAIKTVEVRVPLDSAATLVALQTGDADLSELPLAAGDSELAASSGLTVEKTAGWSTRTVFLMGEPYNSDENLRKAIAYAVNKDNAVLFAGEDGVPAAASLFPEKLLGSYAGSEPLISYDPEKAKEYLSQSGYNGETLRIDITQDYANEATSVQADLQAIGITAEINQVDANTYSELIGANGIGITILDNGTSTASAEDSLAYYATGGYYVDAGLMTSTPDIDAAMEEVLAAETEEARSAAMTKALDAFNDACTLIPLYESQLTYCHNAALQGAEPIWAATTMFYLSRCSFAG